MVAPYYVTHDAGGGGIGTEGDPFTLAEACDAVAAGETVYVKASGAYNVQDGATGSVFNPSTAGTITTPVLWQGYKTTINDGGIVEIDADTNNLDYGLRASANSIHYQVFKNFEFWGANNEGASSAASDYWVYKNCSSHNNGGGGFSGDNYNKYENCISYTNTTYAFDGDIYQMFVSCVAHGSTFAFSCNDGIAYKCLGFDNSDDFLFGNGSARYTGCLGCTTDGENAQVAIDFDNGADSFVLLAYNNIFRDCTDGIVVETDSGELQTIGRNLYDVVDNDNTNCLGKSAGTGSDGTRGDIVNAGGDANLFNNEAGDDYSLHTDSTARNKGLDGHYTVAFWAEYNEGAENPPTE
jgi:hypothetical protein